ncbi:glycosyltransferase family 4 protein [uncultured Chitinophaga sp.]|jgi:Glycosyltransferase|uniref:glycosyltransferase family 4 protein n=1 Tax=uncultured Chitinophaga sp. TaxID=339340 RepID=UPI00262E66B4|nr:glycosyltransferase family 4 protein [uncultured Chitinophaga sp.]
MLSKVLHINSYYLTNRLHYFFCTFSDVNSNSYFIPVYKNAVNVYDAVLRQGQKVYKIYGGLDKRIFFTKIFKCCFVAARRYDIGKHQFIHAHTLFSDGLPAFLLANLYRKKLLITVRNTDVHFFIKRSPVFRLLGEYVLSTAYLVFVPSYAYQKHLVEQYPFLQQKGKVRVLRNGVAPFWIENAFLRTCCTGNASVKLLFVGRVEKDKNLQVLINYLQQYTIGNGIVLNIVGENRQGLNFSGIQGLRKGNAIVYHGRIADEKTLLHFYRSCDVFILLSFRETFGVSYVEAMTQSLPIIYSRGEGIDGFFSNGCVGYACAPDDMHELHEVLTRVMDNYETISRNAYTESLKFNWKNIVTEYENMLC